MSPSANCFDAYTDIKMYKVVYAILLYRHAATHQQKQEAPLTRRAQRVRRA